jgi:prepilin-type N-terminal cleavage/methylation domain-containing protein
MNKYTRGFTLIELLVVIAIIGILSSVVLASLNTARNKGNDANVKANLATIAVQAELYYDQNTNAYGTVSGASCSATGTLFADATITNAINSAEAANGTSNLTCTNSSSAYRVYSPLPSNTATYWCVDSTGFKGLKTALPTSGGYTC